MRSSSCVSWAASSIFYSSSYSGENSTRKAVRQVLVLFLLIAALLVVSLTGGFLLAIRLECDFYKSLTPDEITILFILSLVLDGVIIANIVTRSMSLVI